MAWRIEHGDCLDVMRGMEAGSVDAIVTDPPYGLKFMGREWDHGVPGVPFWTEALRVAKPGAHLLAFGGTRTYHRLTCAIEDAGWEIRDCIMWVYGSGFPKSLDVSKAIDKAAGAEREKVRPRSVIGHQRNIGNRRPYMDNPDHMTVSDHPATPEAARWQGWGTALKPAVEYIVVAQKPLNLRGICGILALKLGGAICQLQSSANTAESSSTSNPVEFGAEFGSALWGAALRCSTPGGLSALMDTSRSGLATPSSLSTALSWLDILGAILQAESTFTTETASSLITDLRILNSLSSQTIADAITEAATGRRGTESSASLAVSIFTVAGAKLASILAPSAPGLATSPDADPGLRPDWRPIIVARKPLDGTVAANVLRHGTGAINVDGCRVGAEITTTHSRGATTAFAKRPGEKRAEDGGRVTPQNRNEFVGVEHTGRWPANLIHDGSDEVVALFPDVTSGSRASGVRKGMGFGSSARGDGGPSIDGSSGSAARFFYCAKADRADRGDGNTHPTVKPSALMRYLVRLVTPPRGTVLDPFSGSGSTGVAALREGCNFIGIEREADYVAIAERRIRDDAPLLNGAA